MNHYTMNDMAEILRSGSAVVVLFGAGSYGRLAHHALTSLGIKVDYFCDSDSKKHGTSYCGTPVIGPETLPGLGKDSHVFISSNFIVPISATLASLNIANVYNCVALFRAADFTGADVGMQLSEIKRRIVTHENACADDARGRQLVIKMIDVEITEACSMRCKDCSNLMQYYSAPKNSDLELLTRTFGKIARAVDRFNEVRVLGGEPFMNKQIDQIIQNILTHANVEKIAIFTNATIVPRDQVMESLVHEKVFLDITHYGKLSRNHDKLIAALEAKGVAYITHPPQRWTDSGTIEYRERTPAALADMFSKCCVNDILTLLHGKLYRCPFAANGMNLKAIPQSAGDFVDLTDDRLDPAAIRRAITELYTERSYINSCLYCNGRDYSTAEVEPALQVAAPLPLLKTWP